MLVISIKGWLSCVMVNGKKLSINSVSKLLLVIIFKVKIGFVFVNWKCFVVKNGIICLFIIESSNINYYSMVCYIVLFGNGGMFLMVV